MTSLVLLSALLFSADPEPTPAIEPAPAAETPDAAAKDNAPKKRSLRKKGEPSTEPKAGDEKPSSESDELIPESQPPVAPPGTEPPKTETDDALDRELGQDLEAADAESADPLGQIAEGMRESEELLAQLTGDDKSMDVQKKVLSEIEKLLQQAQNPPPPQNQPSKQKKKAQQQQRSMTQQKSTNQQQNQESRRTNNSSDRVGPPRSAREQLTPTVDQRSVWGHLSEMLREEMGQYAKENFLAKYREEIERYYTDIARQGQSRSEK